MQHEAALSHFGFRKACAVWVGAYTLHDDGQELEDHPSQHQGTTAHQLCQKRWSLVQIGLKGLLQSGQISDELRLLCCSLIPTRGPRRDEAKQELWFDGRQHLLTTFRDALAAAAPRFYLDTFECGPWLLSYRLGRHPTIPKCEIEPTGIILGQ